MTRYQAAVNLIRALDQHRLLSRVGKATYTDGQYVKQAMRWYWRTRESG